MRALLAALLIVVSVPFAGLAVGKPVASAQTGQNQTGLEAAREFARVSGMWQAILNQVSDLGSVVVDSLRQDRPDLTADQAEDIRQVVNARFDAEQAVLLDAISAVLASHLSAADLHALTSYFASAPGRAQAGMIAQGREMTVEEMSELVLALPPEQRAQVEAFGNSEAALNWLAAQPRFMGEVNEVSNQFGENLVRGAAPQIRAILAR